MALNLLTTYPGQITTDAAYPYGKPRNVGTSGDGTGTPWEEKIAGDWVGFFQALLTTASITPSNTPDTADVSQYLEATQKIIREVSLRAEGYKLTDLSIPLNEYFPTKVDYGGFNFSADGTQLYWAHELSASREIRQYSLGAAWDLTTVTDTGKFIDTTSVASLPVGDFWWKPDGTRLFALDRNAPLIFSYTLSTAWDLSTAVQDAPTIVPSTQLSTFGALELRDDGLSLYVHGKDKSTPTNKPGAARWTMSAAWDLSTASTGGFSDYSTFITGVFDPRSVAYYLESNLNRRWVFSANGATGAGVVHDQYKDDVGLIGLVTPSTSFDTSLGHLQSDLGGRFSAIGDKFFAGSTTRGIIELNSHVMVLT